jgi:hypothetical protein
MELPRIGEIISYLFPKPLQAEFRFGVIMTRDRQIRDLTGQSKIGKLLVTKASPALKKICQDSCSVSIFAGFDCHPIEANF